MKPNKKLIELEEQLMLSESRVNVYIGLVFFLGICLMACLIIIAYQSKSASNNIPIPDNTFGMFYNLDMKEAYGHFNMSDPFQAQLVNQNEQAITYHNSILKSK